jgi:hypothetical protein
LVNEFPVCPFTDVWSIIKGAAITGPGVEEPVEQRRVYSTAENRAFVSGVVLAWLAMETLHNQTLTQGGWQLSVRKRPPERFKSRRVGASNKAPGNWSHESVFDRERSS